MDKIHMLKQRDTGMAAGIKAAALVVILGLFAAVADHAWLVSHSSAGDPVEVATPQAEARVSVPALPAGLRAHAGEVAPHVEAF
jgi:hypothetical protein